MQVEGLLRNASTHAADQQVGVAVQGAGVAGGTDHRDAVFGAGFPVEGEDLPHQRRLALEGRAVEIVSQIRALRQERLSPPLVAFQVGEAQDVGGPVDAPILAVVLTQRRIVGDHTLEYRIGRAGRLDHAGDARFPLRARGPREIHFVAHELELERLAPRSARRGQPIDHPRQPPWLVAQLLDRALDLRVDLGRRDERSPGA